MTAKKLYPDKIYSKDQNFAKNSSASITYFERLGINIIPIIEDLALQTRSRIEGRTCKSCINNNLFDSIGDKISEELAQSSIDPDLETLTEHTLQIAYTSLIYAMDGKKHKDIYNFLFSYYIKN
jgi:hypothetical protein